MNAAPKYARLQASFLATLVVLAALGLLLWAAGLPIAYSVEEPTRLPALRLSLLSMLLLSVSFAAKRLILEATNQVTTSWWDPAPEKFDANLDWLQVWQLVAYDPRHDPLGTRPKLRSRRLGGVLTWVFALSICGWGVALSLLDLIRDPRVPAFLDENGSRDQFFERVSSVSGNLTAYLALLASAITIIFTYSQLRARVRADSRQNWIIHARQLVGRVVALIDAFRDCRADEGQRAAERLWQKMNPLRLELELMLNPSEKDHRLLLYLIQRFADRGRTGSNKVQDAVILRKSIARSKLKPPEPEPWEREPTPDEGEPCLGRAWNRIIYAQERGELVSYILRLSHVVLKREWERVKHTR